MIIILALINAAEYTSQNCELYFDSFSTDYNYYQFIVDQDIKLQTQNHRKKNDFCDSVECSTFLIKYDVTFQSVKLTKFIEFNISIWEEGHFNLKELINA